MTTFVVWPHTIDTTFRPAYAEIVQETVQDNPRNNGTHYLIGSSRITPLHIDTLRASFPDAEFLDEHPEWEDIEP